MARLNPENSEIARSYIEPSEIDFHRLQEFLERKGFSVNADRSIEWRTKWTDFDILDKVAAEVIKTLSATDEEFAAVHLPGISEILLSSPLVMRLNDDTIPRKPAHKVNPFIHTLDVARGLKTEKLSDEEKFWLRFSVFMHDLGKMCVCNNDPYQDHAAISTLFFKEYLLSRGYTEDLTDLRVKVVKYHHLLEQLDKRILPPEFLLQKFTDELSEMISVGVLTLADARSIADYRHFALNSGLIFLEILMNHQEVMESRNDFVATYTNALLALAEELQHAEKKPENLQDTITRLNIHLKQFQTPPLAA